MDEKAMVNLFDDLILGGNRVSEEFSKNAQLQRACGSLLSRISAANVLYRSTQAGMQRVSSTEGSLARAREMERLRTEITVYQRGLPIQKAPQGKSQ
jgi:hypothetical protein